MKIQKILMPYAMALTLASALAAQGLPGPCVDPTSPAGVHAVCLGIPDGPSANLGECLGGTGPCDPNNWNGAKFSTVGLTTSSTKIDYYFVAHNNRILHNSQSLSGGSWTWDLNPSQVVRTFAEDGATLGPNTTVGLGTVLHRNGATFLDPASSQQLSYAMYMIYQFDPDQGSAGHVCVSFSNNGTGWTEPIRVVDELISSSCQNVPCDSLEPSHEACKLQAEAFSGFLLPEPATGIGTALFAGVEGRLSELSCETYKPGQTPPATATQTMLFAADTDNPAVVRTIGTLPFEGIASPTFPNTNPTARLHFFFINLDFAYDPLVERIVLSRVYPFPFDHGDPSPGQCGANRLPWEEDFFSMFGVGTPDNNAPCDVTFCPNHVGTLPMRGQVYSKPFIGREVNDIQGLVASPWTLEADFGRSTGWSVLSGGNCGSRFPADESYQDDIGIDIDSVGFLKTTEGWIPPGGTIRTFLGGYLDRNSACQTADFLFKPTLSAHQYTFDLDWTAYLFTDSFESGFVDKWTVPACTVAPLPPECEID